MAAGSLLLLLDDIASMLDDVSLMTKVAAQKTAGVLGDDLALNAQQVAGVPSQRELPVVFAVARGSLINKAILVPSALAISAFAPWLVTPLLMMGGAYLCFEGVEKLAHSWLHRREKQPEAESLAAAGASVSGPIVDPDIASVAGIELNPAAAGVVEKSKIKGAVRTDFILSAEIIAITLGTVAAAPFLQQVVVLSGIALIMTIAVYGLVAAIVKLDDLGLFLSQRRAAFARTTGRVILAAAPWLMKSLSVIGTIAMFLVGGGILVHGVPPLHHALQATVGSGELANLLPNAVIGLLAGVCVYAAVMLVKRLTRRRTAVSAA